MRSSDLTFRLLEVMAALRAPDTGCPWDLEQTFESIAPHTLEEAYEVLDAIERGDRADLRDELGDLLFQVVYHSRLAEEEGSFDYADVVESVTTKMIRRHPHVFGDVDRNELGSDWWEKLKSEERDSNDESDSVLSGVPVTLPSLMTALKLQKKASRVGFDWTDLGSLNQKLREEVDEFLASASSNDKTGISHELGDLFFTLVNLCRHYELDPEQVLRGCNRRFRSRFEYIESSLRQQNISIIDANLSTLDSLWDEAKARESETPDKS